MSFLNNIEKYFSITEHDVLAVITKIKHGITVSDSDVSHAMKWIVGEISKVTAAIYEVEAVNVIVTGVLPQTDVEAAITAAHDALNRLDAVTKAYVASMGTPQAVITGYVALKHSVALAANAAAVSVAADPTRPVLMAMSANAHAA